MVPYVLNLTQSEAEAAILAAQLTVGTVTQGTSPTVPAGKVKSQNPADRLYVAKGTAVDLVISTGPAMVNVPDVVDRTSGGGRRVDNRRRTAVRDGSANKTAMPCL